MCVGPLVLRCWKAGKSTWNLVLGVLENRSMTGAAELEFGFSFGDWEQLQVGETCDEPQVHVEVSHW